MKPVIYLALDEQNLAQLVALFTEKIAADPTPIGKLVWQIASVPYRDALRKLTTT